MKKVLIIGSGGREHALGYSIAQDSEVDEVLYAKGNPGTDAEKKGKNVKVKDDSGELVAFDGTKKENFEKLADLVEKESIDMVVVGPEQPLVDGIVDFFNERGYDRIFGPTSGAADIEADKSYSSDIMYRAGIPQAESMLCTTTDAAEAAIKKMATPKGIVIKARGLTGGKGVYVCDSGEEALSKLHEHAAAYGPEVLISERLFGQEFSVFGISDGGSVVPLEMSIQDHKPLLDGDEGPNTGGMGAYGPAKVADPAMVRKVANEMMAPLVWEMQKGGEEFKGFLYAAVIMTEEGPKILEYNCRFGDPEAQPAVMMFKDGLYKPISAALDGKLDEVNVEFKPGASCCIVMASNGYPASYEKGFPIGGLKEVSKRRDVKVFHAGTGLEDKKIVTAGGRVLGVTAYSAKGLEGAQDKAYAAVDVIMKATRELNDVEVFVHRNDIGDKGLE
ncbi:phosphoribosylamine--glycine ligase [Candidatus Woesearchaeota archaeon]|nr:phosphoribosylamine--glycine ligase [Candidatus Woesearchaeota archaeon]